MKYLLIMLLGAGFSVPLWADSQESNEVGSKRAMVEELLKATNVDATVDSLYSQLDLLFRDLGEYDSQHADRQGSL